MSKKEGLVLKEWAKREGISTVKLATMLGVERTTAYYIYDSEILSSHYRELLKPYGFDLNNVVKVSNENAENDGNDLLKKVQALENENISLESDIKILKIQLKHKDQSIDDLKEDLKYFKSLLSGRSQHIPTAISKEVKKRK